MYAELGSLLRMQTSSSKSNVVITEVHEPRCRVSKSPCLVKKKKVSSLYDPTPSYP